MALSLVGCGIAFQDVGYGDVKHRVVLCLLPPFFVAVNVWECCHFPAFQDHQSVIELTFATGGQPDVFEEKVGTNDCGLLRLHQRHIGIDHLEKYFPGKGREYAELLRDTTIALYKKCAEYALTRGIIIADTKFEFGLDDEGNLVIGDEMLTPDSSRFWPAKGYEPGHGQPSFDKQFARDWLTSHPGNDWTLPQEIVDKTIAKYLEAYEMITGKKLEA